MTINIETEYELDFNIDKADIINRVIEYCMDYINCPYEAEVNVLLVDNDMIQEINNQHRYIDNPTDVLSFPMIDYEIPGDFTMLENDMTSFNPETGELLLGDIIISLDKVVCQAKQYGHTNQRELAFLVAHSMLHLFGYDHMEDNERIVMENKQKEILEALKIFR